MVSDFYKQTKAEVLILAQEAVLVKRTVFWMKMTRDCVEKDRAGKRN